MIEANKSKQIIYQEDLITLKDTNKTMITKNGTNASYLM